jgi:transcriptional regulator with XRE-family HTH domain
MFVIYLSFVEMKKTGPKQRDEKQKAFQEAIGRRIRGLRKDAGYTSHEQFALEFDFARAQYLTYEHGRDMRITTLLRICQAFNMSLEEFFSEGFEYVASDA